MTPSASPQRPVTGPLRVALLYKRYMPLDEQLLRMLESQLAACGFQVLTDKNANVGVDWAKEIEARIRSVDAVIPIISGGSAQSEMIAYEIEMAHETAQRANGRPRLIPVLVNHPEPLPDALAAILDRIPSYSWSGDHHDQTLLTELIKALNSLPRPGDTPPAPTPGVVRLRSRSATAPAATAGNPPPARSAPP